MIVKKYPLLGYSGGVIIFNNSFGNVVMQSLDEQGAIKDSTYFTVGIGWRASGYSNNKLLLSATAVYTSLWNIDDRFKAFQEMSYSQVVKIFSV